MAGRSSVGVGVGSVLFILALLSLGFLVLWAMYFTWYKDSQQQLQTAKADVTDFVGAGERNQDSVRNMVAQAKSARKSVVSFMLDNMQNTMQTVTGSRTDTPTSLAEKLKNVGGASGGTPMLTLLQNQGQTIAQLEKQYKQADADRATANNNLNNEIDRTKRMEAEHESTIKTLTEQLNRYKTEVEDNRKGIDTFKSNLDAASAKVKGEFEADRKRLADQLAKVTEENLILKNQVAALRNERNKEILRPGDEFALVDGSVVGVDGAERKAFISIGSRHKVRLGMSFVVYADASAIRPDDNGNYPRGKATLEVVNVQDTSSTCRITSEVRGNPVVAGDVLANAVYDPNKTYKFVIYGNFDINRDGYATPGEATDARALVEAWGGKAVDDLAGDVDFLLLGERPLLPAPPSSDAPFEVLQEYTRQQRIVSRYDELYRKASEASVPILNENRFYTLIGKTPAAAR